MENVSKSNKYNAAEYRSSINQSNLKKFTNIETPDAQNK